MQSRCLRFTLALVVLVLAPAHLALAKESFAKITVSGPGLRAPIEVTDRATVDILDYFFGLQGWTGPIILVDRPTDQQPYEISYFYKDKNGNPTPAFGIRYYPNPAAGPSYLYDYAFGKGWSLASAKADTTLKRLLQQHGVAPSGAQRLPATGAEHISLVWLLVSGALFVIGSFLSRRVNRRQAGGPVWAGILNRG